MKHSSSRSRRAALVAAILALGAGSAAWSIAASPASPTHASVTVKVDEKPISSTNSPLGPSYSPIVKRVSPSVVKVHVTEAVKNMPAAFSPFMDQPGLREFFGDQFGGGNPQRGGRQQRQLRLPQQEGAGSGVIVSADGYILTNSHVVKGMDTIKVTLNDGRELKAKVVGTDPQSDLAVIKIEATNLPAITFADSDKVEVGDRVLAVGNPFDVGQTVTSGMISGLGRATMGLDYEDFIQTDAAINPGNSGGALVDAEGRLVGINTAILSRSGGSQGIGFAIPANLAHSVMEQLASNGKVVRSYLGVSVQDISPALSEELKLKTTTGALVTDITPGSPADKAGIQNGDVVTQLDGKPVTDGRHLKLAVATIAPGSKVSAEVVRNGKPVKVELNLVAKPTERSRSRGGDDDEVASAAGEDTGTLNGVGVGDLDAQARQEFDVPGRIVGALVTSVDPSSPAAAAGLQPGDVIQEINRHKVKNSEEAVKLTEKTESKKTFLRVWSQRGSRFVVVDETAAPAVPNS